MRATPWFSVCCYRVVAERTDSGSRVRASVEVRIGDAGVHRSAIGVGPVHALDQALRACLRGHFPELDATKLADYSVAVLNADLGTAAQVKVLLSFTDDRGSWDTGYVSENIIDASMEALCAGAVVGLMRARAERPAVVVG